MRMGREYLDSKEKTDKERKAMEQRLKRSVRWRRENRGQEKLGKWRERGRDREERNLHQGKKSREVRGRKVRENEEK